MRSRHASRHPPPESRDLTETLVLSIVETEPKRGGRIRRKWSACGTTILAMRSRSIRSSASQYKAHSSSRCSFLIRVRVAGTRWTSEACFEAAKGGVGLDPYEVRSWTGQHRHITLAMLAHAYLAVLRCTAGGEKRRTRSPSRSAAAHRAGSAPPVVAPGLGPTA